MVLRKDAATELSFSEKESIRFLDRFLEGRLLRHHGEPATFAVYEFNNCINFDARKELVVEKVLQLYREAGWTVEVISDQKEGDSIRFS